MEVRFLTLSDFTPVMLIIGLVVLILQLIACFKDTNSNLFYLPLCILVFGLFVSSLSPVWNIGPKEFQALMGNLMYYFCISSIGDIIAWLIYYTYCLVRHKY